MATYRYLTTDLLSNTIIGELPLTGCTWGQALNAAGNFNGHMMLSDSRIQNVLGTYNASNVFTLDYVTTPSKTGLYVERDGVIVWGGIIWARTYDSGSQTLSLVAREFESYFERRRITTSSVGGGSGANVWATGTDQFTIVKKLVDDAQAVPNGSLGISTASIGASGQGIANVLAIYDYEKRNLFDTILQLSQQNAPYGFDFNISCAYDSNFNLTRALNLFYPRKGLGISANYNNPMIEFPSVMVSYSYPEDGASLVNQLFGIGPGTNEGQYISTAFAGSSFTAGFPLLEDVASFTNVPDPRMVDQLTAAQVVARGVPVTVMSASWVPTTEPVSGNPVSPNIGDFTTGDMFRIRITDDRFPNTLETGLRLSKFDVRVGDDGSAEMVTGTFVIPTY